MVTNVAEPASPGVVIFTADEWDSACPVVRLTGPLEAAGFRVTRGNTDDEVDAALVESADYVVIQRDFPRLTNAYDEVIARARAARKPIIYEMDDLLFDTPIEHPVHNSPKYRAARPAVLRALLDADLVTVSTDPLYKEIVPLNPNTHLLPNYLNDSLWPQAERRHDPERKPVVIGYIAGGTHQPDLEAVTPALIEVLQRYGNDVRLQIQMPIPPNSLADLPNVVWNSVYLSSYSDFASYVSGLVFDIVIAPLLDTRFNQCKSNLKYLENASTGGAGVYSREIPFESIVAHGENGMLASTNGEWVDALSRLIESAELRNSISANARATVQNQWLLSQNAWRWNEVYDRAVARRETANIPSSVQKIARRFYDLHGVLQTELEQTEHKLDENRSALAQLETDKKELRSQASGLKIAHDAALSLIAAQQEEARALDAIVTHKQSTILELETTVDSQRAEMRALANTVAARQSAIQILETTVTAQLEHIQSLNVRVNQLVRNKISTRQWADKVFTRNEELQASLDRSELQNREMTARWSALTQTVSWRAMQPVWRALHKLTPPGSRRNHLLGSMAWWLTYLGEHGLKALCMRTVVGAARIFNNYPATRAIARHTLPHSFQARIQQLIAPVTAAVTPQPALPPIVAAAELNPFPTLTQSPRMLTTRRFSVLYITIDPKLVSHQVRVANYQEYLRLAGIEANFVDAGDVASHMTEIPRYDVVVIFRAVRNDAIRRVYDVCHQAGVPVVYDIDDYIFDTAVMTPQYVDGLRFLSEADLSRYLSDVPKYREAMVSADWCTVSTEYLAKRVREMELNAFVLPNGITHSALRRCAEVLDATHRNSKQVILGYFSGTKTHQKDFALIVEPLVQVMTEYQNVRLLITGFVDVDEFPALIPFLDRIDRRAPVPWEQLYGEIATVDINLAPLEIDNPFCQAKSELKYLDAGFVKVPTVASATAPFVQAIRDGENGFLAANADDWVRSLRHLIQHPESRVEMGEKAYQHVTRTYTPEALVVSSRAVYTQIINIQRKRLGAPDTALALSFVLPSSATRDIEMPQEHLERVCTLARHLVDRGHEVRIYAPFDNMTALRQFRNDKRNERLKFGGDISDMVCCDALIATDWTSAHWVKKLESFCRRGFYLLQSDEAALYPMGDQTINAEAALDLGLYLISLGPWYLRKPRAKYACEGDSLPLFVERKTCNSGSYESSHSPLAQRTIVFHAQPEVMEYCFELGVEALTILDKRICLQDKRINVVMLGNGNLSTPVPFPYTVDARTEPEHLATLYASASAGLALNTISVPAQSFQMLANGCPVVDLDLEQNRVMYDGCANVFLAEPHAEGVAAQLARLLTDDIQLQKGPSGPGWTDAAKAAGALEQLLMTGVENAPDK